MWIVRKPDGGWDMTGVRHPGKINIVAFHPQKNLLVLKVAGGNYYSDRFHQEYAPAEFQLYTIKEIKYKKPKKRPLGGAPNTDKIIMSRDIADVESVLVDYPDFLHWPVVSR